MNNFISKNSIAIGKLLNRYKLKSTESKNIIKAAQKNSSVKPDLNILARKIKFKESNTI